MSGLARVLLVEDDSSLRRFVGMALEDLDIELVAVASVDEALAELAKGPVALILTDLMLPGRSGYDLIDALAADPALRGAARVAVLSAGLDPAARQRLERPEVWRLLSKPCKVGELVDCVNSAVRDMPAVAAPAPPPTPIHPKAAAIAEYFCGDAPLYDAFRAACLDQFQLDVAEGARAVASHDAAALRRLAHSLKSVLLTLGHAEASSDAAALEARCAAGDWGAILPLWLTVLAHLESFKSATGYH